MAVKFFRERSALRRWLERHHATAEVLEVGFHRRASGRASLSWAESVEEALCFGWIDGVRHRLDADRYRVRFTPRRPGSRWSAVNVRKIEALTAAGRMHAAGSAAFAARRPERTARYSYEQRPQRLPAPYAALLRANPKAARFFAAQIPSYRRAATWWVVSAVKEETRQRRAAQLVALSARGALIPQFLRPGAGRATPRA